MVVFYVWTKNAAFFKWLMKFKSNPSIIYYGFKSSNNADKSSENKRENKTTYPVNAT